MPYGFERLLGWPIGMQCTRTLACVQEGDARLLAAVQLRSRPFEPLILYTSEMHQKPARAIKHDRRTRCWQLAIEALEVVHVEAALLPPPIAATKAHAVMFGDPTRNNERRRYP